MNESISLIGLESVCVRFERIIKRLWILVILLILLLVGSNCLWFWYEKQWDYTECLEIEADQTGTNNFVSGGNILYGTESQIEACKN
jgi:hypothetical protein